MGGGGGRLAGEDVDGAVAEWGCAMKFVALVLASGIFVLGVVGCGGGGPQVEEHAETRSVPTSVPTVASTRVPTATVAATTVPTGPQLSIAVAQVRDDIPKYDRDEWRHWVDDDGDCQDARQEALIAESETPVTYTNEDRCRVASGSWEGPYTGERFTDPGDLDIDHVVPLANAHWSGGWAWNEDRKREYANDLSYEGHLIAVQASANRTKGSKGPEDWKPPERGYWCQYAVDWISIKNAWELTATESEAEALAEMLDTCEPSRSLSVVRVESSQPDAAATPTTTPDTGKTYDSCDEAADAGEARVRGSQGSGRGFPAAMVPSARDGDGDGVVCER
ncbi:MAG: DUF1524 domain-containing protein [Dehalococcoidia bacterium]|nr:DUF1524 domain-containing protein [Dehalococcoidia bacterium]